MMEEHVLLSAAWCPELGGLQGPPVLGTWLGSAELVGECCVLKHRGEIFQSTCMMKRL